MCNKTDDSVKIGSQLMVSSCWLVRLDKCWQSVAGRSVNSDNDITDRYIKTKTIIVTGMKADGYVGEITAYS